MQCYNVVPVVSAICDLWISQGAGRLCWNLPLKLNDIHSACTCPLKVRQAYYWLDLILSDTATVMPFSLDWIGFMNQCDEWNNSNNAFTRLTHFLICYQWSSSPNPHNASIIGRSEERVNRSELLTWINERSRALAPQMTVNTRTPCADNIPWSSCNGCLISSWINCDFNYLSTWSNTYLCEPAFAVLRQLSVPPFTRGTCSLESNSRHANCQLTF